MTSSNGHIFRVTGPLCGEFTGHRGIPITKRPMTRSFNVFFDLRPNKRLCKQSWCWWFEKSSRSLWRQRNGWYSGIILQCRLNRITFYVNSLWPSVVTRRPRSGSPLVSAMACRLKAPSHYLNQCWRIISKVQWHLSRAISRTIAQQAITNISLKLLI